MIEHLKNKDWISLHTLEERVCLWIGYLLNTFDKGCLGNEIVRHARYYNNIRSPDTLRNKYVPIPGFRERPNTSFARFVEGACLVWKFQGMLDAW